MSLHNGLDLVGIATSGTYTETYGSANMQNISNLFASFGYLENAPGGVIRGWSVASIKPLSISLSFERILIDMEE